MAIPDREAIRAKLDSLGIIEVRKRLESGAYATNKVPIVQAWLAERSGSVTHLSSGKSPTLFDRYSTKLKNHPLVATILVIAAVVGGFAQFTDAVSKVWTLIPNVLRPAKELPALPGDSGWLLLGDLDPNGERYIRGPLYKIEKSSYPDKSLTPRKGEQIRLTAERNVVIAGFKSTGLQRLMAPLGVSMYSLMTTTRESSCPRTASSKSGMSALPAFLSSRW